MIKIYVVENAMENISIYGELDKVSSEMKTVIEAFHKCLTEKFGSSEKAKKKIEDITNLALKERMVNKITSQDFNGVFDLKEQIKEIKAYQLKDGGFEEVVLPKSKDGSPMMPDALNDILDIIGASLLNETMKGSKGD